jgi:pyrophosphate--fructose-6-phosphate 1-phosphotransferase
MSFEISYLESVRRKQTPRLPKALLDLSKAYLKKSDINTSLPAEISALFPHSCNLPFLQECEKDEASLPKRSLKRIGVVFSGGQAPGGHNVIAGLLKGLQELGGSELIGFLEGPSGILKGRYKILSESEVQNVVNTGGFDLLGSGRTKIETTEQLEAAFQTAQSLELDGLVIIGGDDSNTNAAVLAEYFYQKNSKTCIIGVPKTIDGDLKNAYVPISFGFDSASRVYSELIGNLARDCLSAKKYYHFIRLMGRSASHITLECALSTHPNIAFIAEEVAEKKKTLQEIVSDLCNLILERASSGKNYGIVLIPEGLIEFTPDVSLLIQELNTLLAEGSFSLEKLSEKAKECFLSFPQSIQKQLLLGRDPHGNVQLSHIETERLLADMVFSKLQGKVSFQPICHFFGYEGRSGFPSLFDSAYCYALGKVAALLISHGVSGYMCFLSCLEKTVEEWSFGGIPLTSLMRIEMRKGKKKAVIEKALVDLKGKAFQHLAQKREEWKLEDSYLFPGPIQLLRENEMSVPISLRLDQGCTG